MPDREQLVPETITCIDCGGRCHLMTRADDEWAPGPGDIVVYRCEDCHDRWDIEVPPDDALD